MPNFQIQQRNLIVKNRRVLIYSKKIKRLFFPFFTSKVNGSEIPYFALNSIIC